MFPLRPSPSPVQRFRLSLAIGALALLSACGGGKPVGAPGAGASAVPVTTTVVAPREWHDTIAALGTVNARESITVTAKVSETVERVHFDSGDDVAAGAVLVTLSGNQQQATLQAAEAAAADAEQQYRRGNELAAQQLIARASVDTLRATRDSARARVAEMRANIGDRNIRAPFAGVLGIRQVSPGALVTPGTPIATLDDISSVYVDFPVPETRLARVAPGQPLAGRSAAYPGQLFEGEVQTIDTRIDPASRAVTVRGSFANPDRRLHPGMLIQVQLQQRARQAMMVPEIAVIQVGRDTFVYLVGEDETVSQAPIDVGVREDGLVEVVEGLAPGDRIVVDGTGKLRPGMTITEGTVAEAKAQPADTGTDGPAE
ncbi:efflux RND transporter periplasmic adaptor subunit [Luteimonas sp. BDR2-5]|uniref:efflux RND transporter periplasmic adaptor subunit n=1 Tax=Proluteimonas luteida TaxID=2878685 RepID=UPI001E586BF9|nr:efflux RND transporter periplasmic adaptor subunit [Luteimonas sp. BDR2-5]MCD9028865.1 efflux RND transporter periplasmic adaptor subunit [Luteimonas sp. BDR2-5]